MKKTGSFCKRLQQLIDLKKISQVEFAREISVQESRVSDWLSEKVKKPHRKTIVKIADYFKCRPDWLQNGTGEMFEEKTTELSGVSYKEAMLKQNMPQKTQATETGYGYTVKESAFRQYAASRLAPIIDWMADDFECNTATLETFMKGFMADFETEYGAYRDWLRKNSAMVVKKQHDDEADIPPNNEQVNSR